MRRGTKALEITHTYTHTEYILKAFTGKLSEDGRRFIITVQKLRMMKQLAFSLSSESNGEDVYRDL